MKAPTSAPATHTPVTAVASVLPPRAFSHGSHDQADNGPSNQAEDAYHKRIYRPAAGSPLSTGES